MSIVLIKLVSSGIGKPDSVIDFDPRRTLIRGPSDTGKSYVRECLWYLFGGDKVPRNLPESKGYDSLTLTFVSGTTTYEFRRGLIGGHTTIETKHLGDDGQLVRTPVVADPGELLVKLSGAEGKQLLRNKSSKGPVTSSDLRHWFLITQPNIISESPTYNVGFDAPQRIAAFNLFLTGDDDHAYELAKKNAEVQRISGQLQLAEEQHQRLQKVLSDGGSRDETQDQLRRVDGTLSLLKHQYDQRASKLRELRKTLASAAENLSKWETQRDHRKQMVDRFQLLQSKYESDIARLSATWEGMAVFELLPSVPCPLCETPSESQVNPKHLEGRTREKFRTALNAEIQKIHILKSGLVKSLERELLALSDASQHVSSWQSSLAMIESLEAKQLDQARTEFSADPETLAVQRSELVSRLQRFEELESLSVDIDTFKKAKKNKHAPLSRNVGDNANLVANLAKSILHSWGFDSVANVSLDAEQCDLEIDGRARLGFGAGKRALFLSALNVALLQHSLALGFPHLGIVVLDSPLKAYADPNLRDANDVPLATVTERFYSWLSDWEGPGQLVVLENQNIEDSLARKLDATQFTGIPGDGRSGFYPVVGPEQLPSA